MQKCLVCKAGTLPDLKTEGDLGYGRCVSCNIAAADLDTTLNRDVTGVVAGANTYRSFFTVADVCAYCTPGHESIPSNNSACTPW